MRYVIKSNRARWIIRCMQFCVVTVLSVSAHHGLAFDDSLFSNDSVKEDAVEGERYWGWHGSLNMAFGFATQSHNIDGFNRTDTGFVEELYLLKLEREWELSDVFMLKIGGMIDARRYHQPRVATVPEDQYEDSEYWLRPQETYLQWNISEDLWARHGYYTVSFGMSDAFDVMDKLTPRDNSRWGQELSSSSREPLHLSQITWDMGAAKLGLTASHRFQGNRIALAGSDYDSFVEFRADGARVNDPAEPRGFKTEWILDARGTFPSGDWAILGGEIYNKNASLVFDGFDENTIQPIFSPQYTRTALAGIGVDYVTGAFVWKGEAVWLNEFDEMKFPGQESAAGKVSQLQYLIGADFAAPSNSVISLEAKFSKLQGQHALDDSTYDEISLQITRNWMNNQLYSQFRFSTMPDNAGQFCQLLVAYDVNDRWKIEGKYTDYIKTEKNNYFSRFESSDRFMFGVNFSF